ncbi:MAG TPA: glucose-6-phosphate dehydrogenase [Pirellulales bacterium]|jgi:glucose-6-phosphate 1-dehydrogenase|nr:glucose-6-phosphate dehydrogenase [Pirellulales bacterium]
MSATIVIFGASGDLTSRKLVPALYELVRKNRLPPDTRVVGFSRTAFSDDQWRAALAKTTAEFVGHNFDAELWKRFAQQIHYQPGDIGQAADFVALGNRLNELEKGAPSTRVYYLATAPQFYEPAIAHLGQARLAEETAGNIRRLVIEKPFGTDLASARALNVAVHQVFAERQIYRIDHYLGKETVQNILVLRFANAIFEPIWNRNYVDHVQITVAEEVPVGRRGDYYDRAGVLRDMFQNHLLQLLMVTAMEPPTHFESEAVRNEKVKVLEAIQPMSASEIARETVRAQYRGYRQEPGVAPDSQTATFAAVRLAVDNWRWQGVPFFLRSGKVMSCRTSQIVIQFRNPPHMVFAGASRRCEANRLVIQIQPAEGIQLHLETKVPDAGMRLRMTDLDFSFQKEFQGDIPDSYQRLLLDTLQGDASLFARADEVETAWTIIDPILAAWSKLRQPKLAIYEAGGWGPEESAEWMSSRGCDWFDVCPVLAH